MSRLLANNFRYRRTFAKSMPSIPIDNLIAIQLRSYEEFLQFHTPSFERKDMGLQAVFKSVFPISDFSDRAHLEFLHYELEKPKNDVDEFRERG
jgi:DNA-directed RNA polymerase subunit beta